MPSPLASEESVYLSLRLIKAGELARRGQLKEAQTLLAPDGTPPEDPAALHAFAALVTQEGNYPRALALWKSLLEREPQHPEARSMIEAIETWMARPPWFSLLPAGAALLLVVSLVCWWVLRPATRPAPAPLAGPPAAAPATRPAPSAARPASSPPTAPAPETPPVRFQLPPPPAKPKKN